MGLRDLRIPRATIRVPGAEEGYDSFTVRGLSLPDVQTLAEKHGPTFALLFDKFKTLADNTPAEMAVIAKAVLDLAPALAHESIALASGEPDAADVIKELPLFTMLEALEWVFVLSFRSEEEVKKALEIVTRAATGAQSLIGSLQLPTT